MDKHKIERRLKRLEEKLKAYDIPNPQDKFTFFGGWDKGYLEGQIRVLEEWLDECLEQEEMMSFYNQVKGTSEECTWEMDLMISEACGKTIQFKQNRDVDFCDISDFGFNNIKACINEYPHFGKDRYRVKP